MNEEKILKLIKSPYFDDVLLAINLLATLTEEDIIQFFRSYGDVESSWNLAGKSFSLERHTYGAKYYSKGDICFYIGGNLNLIKLEKARYLPETIQL